MELSEREDDRTDAPVAGVSAVDSTSDVIRALRRQLAVRSRELARSEQRFRDVIERNADAQVVVDGSGTVRFCNGAAAQLFGSTCDRLIGTPLGFPLVVGDTTEVDLCVGGTPRVAEMRVMRTEWDGSDAYIASLRDITARRTAEEDARRLIAERTARAAAEESAAHLRFLAESSIVLSSSLDFNATLSSLARLCVQQIADWTIVYGLDENGRPRRLDVAHRDPDKANLARELREIPISATGRHPVLEVLRTGQSRIESTVTEEMLETMTTFPRELEIARTLGVGSLMLVPLFARERPLGAIGFIRCDGDDAFTPSDQALAEDVARRAALAVDNAVLYADARRANQSKADFLAVVSHDLRTPLTAILGYSDLLCMGVPEPVSDGTRERVDRIRTSAKHLIYLLNELLAFARLDAGKDQIRRTRVELVTVMRDVASIMEPLAAQRGLALTVDLPPSAVVDTDPDKVRQILLNLVGNAVKYTAAGCVTLSATVPGNRVVIAVRDTGAGIARRDLENIFEPFWQVDPTQRARGGGTGLGLSVVKRLTALLGGSVAVESELGSGSTFTVTLPRFVP